MPPTAAARRPYDWASDPLLFLLLFVLTPVSSLVGLLAMDATVWAAANALALFPWFAFAVRKGRLARAVLFAALWAVLVVVTGAIAAGQLPQRTEATWPQAVDERAALLTWIVEGGSPGEPRVDATHGAVAALASLPTAGLAGLYLDARALNTRAIASARLLKSAARPLAAAALFWPPWYVVQHGALWALVALCAAPVLQLSVAPLIERWRWLLLAVILWAGSVLAAEILSPRWWAWLRQATGLA